jgi:hypothetical protein
MKNYKKLYFRKINLVMKNCIRSSISVKQKEKRKSWRGDLKLVERYSPKISGNPLRILSLNV